MLLVLSGFRVGFDSFLKSYWVSFLSKTVPQAIHASSLQIVHKQSTGCVNKLVAEVC